MARKTLSDLGIAALNPRAKPYLFPDPQQPGLSVRVSPRGAKSYMLVTRDPTGRQVWKTIGHPAEMSIEEARDRAKAVKTRIKAGLPADEPKPVVPETFRQVSENWIKRHVEAKGLRTKGEIERSLAKYVTPAWGDRDFLSIRRSDIAQLLDGIEDRHGARQADIVLAYLRAMATWYAARRDDYVPPFIRGMRRAAPVKRDRVLTDDELRAIWREAEKPGNFGSIVRIALLTAQRRDKVASMRWADVAGGVWTVPAERRSKGTGGALALSGTAVAILDALPRQEGNPYVFAGRTQGSHFDGFSKTKKAFDAALPMVPTGAGGEAEIAHWTLHDLRRTARSLMSRAGVRPDIAERVLGHVVAGVEGVYDRHRYETEKGQALQALADLIARILKPPSGNVVALEGKRA
ncbi:tyrosine-type recombinase/integrase [Aestuariivirga sp.]|jgi:integrase|uniref:tyrosine-type recombinase/integrase n=1 Tax=Aestuariivirga sp. TaxID=2650926 RepID=UPI003784FFCF